MHRIPRRSFATGFGVALAGIGSSATTVRAAEFQWKFGTDYGWSHPIGVRAVEAFARIRRETNGRVDVKAFNNGELGGALSMFSQLRVGALEILATAGAAPIADLVPEAGIEGIAFAFKDQKTVFGAMDGDLGATIREAIAAKGMVVLERGWDQGFRVFTTSTHPIRTVADLQGVKLRIAPSKFRLDTFRSMGASPTVVSVPETYSAMQTHVVDGSETSIISIDSTRWYEVQKYCSLSNHMWGGCWTLVNKDAWNALPRDLQQIVRRNLNQAAILERRDFALFTGSVQEKLARLGLIFNQCDRESFKQKLRASGYYDRYRQEFGAPLWTSLEKYTGRLA